MTRICPGCNYVRQASDSAPEWQCPSCERAYIKAAGPAVSADYGRYGKRPVEKDASGSSLLKWLLIGLFVSAALVTGRTMWQIKHRAAVAAIATTQPEVILYGTTWCGYCKAAREFFADNGIRYIDMDVEKNADGNAALKKLGGRGVPVIVVGEEVIHGYNKDHLKESLGPWLR
ncbi:hypothetical protein BH11PSE11_BH11PSE11_31960 [soil metagenome]